MTISLSGKSAEREQNVVLVGFMASGKSTIGRKLAKELGYRFVDTDEVIEARAGRPVRQIFEERGEAEFRKLETGVIAELAKDSRLVIASGGGMVLAPRNVELLKGRAFFVYLKTDSSVIYKRVRGSKNRPLLNVPDPLAEIEELMRGREKIYQQVADMTVDTGRATVGEAIKKIQGALKNGRWSG